MAQNGRLPRSEIADTLIGVKVRKDLAPSVDRLATAFYLHFGKPLSATDGYRDLATQVYLKRIKGPYAAAPGTSNHGWGTALDLSSRINVHGSPENRWMNANGADYGWGWPTWASNANPNDGMFEPWHREATTDRKKSAPRVLRPKWNETGYGNRGTKVKHVQNLLNKLGPDKYKVTADGDYGMGTAIAVMKFQWVRGLPGTGVVDSTTLKHLDGRLTPVSEAVKNQVKKVQGAVNGEKDGVWGRDTDKRLWALRQASAYGRRKFPYGVKFAQDVVGTRKDGVWGTGSGRAHTETVKDVQRALGLKVTGTYTREVQRAVDALKRKTK